MSTTKVLHVIARMNIGGTAHYVGDLIEKIPNSALATGYVQGSEIEDSIVTSLLTYRIPHMGRRISPVNDLRAWIELRRIIRQLNPEIVHTHTFKSGLIGRLVGGNHKRVHTFHGHLFDDQSFTTFEKRIITFAERFLALRTDFLISVGEKVGRELRAAGIGTSKPWLSIAPGVNPCPLINKTEARKRLGLHPEHFLVGWMARMTNVKNPFLALEVARELPQVHFVMAGGGDLLETVKLSAPANVSIIGWTNAALFWSAVDCALSTSDNEGMPIALIEAQLAGIPAVATDVGSNSEVIENGVTGIITDKTAHSLTTALKTIMMDSDLLQEMSSQAVYNSEKKFNAAKMISTHHDLYIHLGNENYLNSH